MAKKANKTSDQKAYEKYARENLAIKATQLYVLPKIGLEKLDSALDSDLKQAMADLVFHDENIIEQAKDSYRKILENDLAARFSPDQQRELEASIPRLVKNYGISLTSMRTAKRRQRQIVKTFDVKLFPGRTIQEQLHRKQLEAKWLYNDILDHGVDDYDLTKKIVQVYNSKEEQRYDREYRFLTQRERQGILDQIKSSIRGLSASKKRGRKVGALKFKSRIDTIPLDQYGITHNIADDLKHISIAGIKKSIYARGLEQLKGWEYSVAKLMWQADGIHMKITAYKDLEELNETKHSYRKRGTVTTFDPGVHDQMTFSDGTIVNLLFENSASWRAADRKLSAQQKGSQGRNKTKQRRRKAALRDTYKKDDAANKVCALIAKNSICITQDDRIESWRRKDSFAHGSKKIQHGILGRVMSKLKEHGGVYMLDRWTATTQVCPKCHEKTKHGLDEQGNIVCSHCDFEYPRNAGAAWSMEYAALEEFGEMLPDWFSPIEVCDSVEETLGRARKRSAWDKEMPYSIDDPKILDGILGHKDDKTHVGEDMSGRIKPRVRDGWTSKKKTRGKKDKWAKYSPRYNDYVRVGETPEHADEPVPMISSRSTEQGRRAHNKSRSRARADRRAYRWSCLRRKRREREHERCAKRYEQRLAKQNNKSTTIENSQCTLGTRGINAGGDGRKSLRECRGVASSKKPEATTSGPC